MDRPPIEGMQSMEMQRAARLVDLALAGEYETLGRKCLTELPEVIFLFGCSMQIADECGELPEICSVGIISRAITEAAKKEVNPAR